MAKRHNNVDTKSGHIFFAQRGERYQNRYIFFRENNRKVLIFLDLLIDYIFTSNWRFTNVSHSRVKLKQPELFIYKFPQLFRISN